MKFISALVSLLFTASAVDLALHYNDACGGSFLLCSLLNPNLCCSTAANFSFRSVGARNNPPGVKLDFSPNRQPNCVLPTWFRGTCSPPGVYRSASFRTTSNRRAATDAGAGDQSDCQRPDVFILPDGTEYDLSTLDDAEFDSFLAISIHAVSAKEIPEQFQSLQVSY